MGDEAQEHARLKETVLQHLTLPKGLVDGERGLYVRGCEGASFPLHLREGETADFRTHFNLIPIRKLRELAGIDSIDLVLDFEGDIAVEACFLGEAERTESLRIQSGVPSRIDIPEGSLLGISATAGKNGATLAGGRFTVHPEKTKYVKLALVVTTFRHERITEAKAAAISDFLSGCPETDGHLSVIIVDNGRTLSPDDVPGCILIPNENLGGSGGFARGMVEAMGDGNVTHIALNDDDAVLDPEVLFRTVSWFSIIPPDSGVCIGGAMLNLDRPTVVHEAGATYHQWYFLWNNHEVDVSGIDGNLELDRSKKADYSGWWYFALPRELVEENGYPLPLFFKDDDVEYGVRLGADVEIIPGISVWHPSYLSKYSDVNAYYYVRNMLVLGCTTGDMTGDDLERIFDKPLVEAAGYRYLSADLMLRGIEDFLKGPDAVFSMMGEGMIQSEDPVFEDGPSVEARLRPRRSVRTRGRGFRILTLNGLLLPSAGDVETDFIETRTEFFYRAGKAAYVKNGRGCLCERSLRRTLSIVWRTLRLRSKARKAFPRLKEEYADSLEKYSSREFWKSFWKERADVLPRRPRVFGRLPSRFRV